MSRHNLIKHDKDLDSDINRVKYLHDHTYLPKTKQAYYNLWYALVVMRHRNGKQKEGEI